MKHVFYEGLAKGQGPEIVRRDPDSGVGYVFYRGRSTQVPSSLHDLLMAEDGFFPGSKATELGEEGVDKAAAEIVAKKGSPEIVKMRKLAAEAVQKRCEANLRGRASRLEMLQAKAETRRKRLAKAGRG